MHIGQPISWEKGNKEYIGIVKEILPDKAGVIALIRVSTAKGYAEVKVSKPHKIRDAETAVKVLKAFKDFPEAKEHIKAMLIQTNLAHAQTYGSTVPKKPPQVVKEASPETFTNALAELGDDTMVAPTLAEILGHEPTQADWLRFYGMGLDVEEHLKE